LLGIGKAYNYVLNGMAVAAAIAVSIAFVLIIVDVLLRLVGISPPAFTITYVEYILLYFTMFSAPWLVRVKGHVFIDAVTQLLPSGVKNVLAKIVYFLSICSALTFSYISVELLVDAIQTQNLDVRGVDMPAWLLFAPMPLCFLLVAVEFFRFLIGIDDMYGSRGDVKESA
jgi:TRAP-type C4-dicarboxylate transport system permease small subunit